MKKVWIIVLAVLLVLGVFVWYKYFFVFAEGVKSGYLNYANKKGYIFKTYEGKMIQSGFRSQAGGTIQSYEFSFSVEDKQVADSLMRCSGKEVELHYREYLGTLPWRGVNKFVVDKIVSVKP